MLEQVNVFYEGWNERWQWGTLVSTTALTGRPLIVFGCSAFHVLMRSPGGI